MLAMVTLAVNTFREVITEYVSRPTDVVTRLERESDLAFPAVTLCNINPSRSSLISDHSRLASAFPSQAKVRRKRYNHGNSCSFLNMGKFSCITALRSISSHMSHIFFCIHLRCWIRIR